MLGGADRQPVFFLPGRGVQPGQPGSVGQPAAAGLQRQATLALTRATTCPPASRIAVIRSWPGKFRSKQITRPANRSGRRRTRRASSVCSPARCSPQDRAEHGAAGAGGQRDDPQLRERRGALAVLRRGAGAAEHRPVRRRVRHVHQHPVGGAHHHPGQQHRRRLVIADQRPGRLARTGPPSRPPAPAPASP